MPRLLKLTDTSSIDKPRSTIFLALDRQTAKCITYTRPYGIISVQDPRNRQTYDGPATNNHTYGVLKLDFHDIGHDGNGSHSTIENARMLIQFNEEILAGQKPDTSKIGNLIYFNKDMANQILDFYLDAKTAGVNIIIAHCDAGACRSPAICAALQKIETDDDEKWFKSYVPNMLVYNTILETAHERGLYRPSKLIEGGK